MIIFDADKFTKNVIKSGIYRDDKYARAKMKMVVEYYLLKTTYSASVIRRKLKTIAKDCFEGLLNSQIDDIVSSIIEQVSTTPRIEREITPLHIYKEEMDTILSLNGTDIQKLAFAFLVYAKFIGCKNIGERNADLLKLAGLYYKCSGTKRSSLLNELTLNGIVEYDMQYSRRHKKNGIPASVVFNLPFLKTNGETVITITNFNDIMLYYRQYVGDKRVFECQRCCCPVERTSSTRKYCDDCAAEAKREANRKYAM